MRLKALLLVMILVFAGLIAGCDNGGAALPPPDGTTQDKQQAVTNPPASATTDTMHVTVYHATKDAMYLVPEVHTVPKTPHPAQDAVELLLSNPKNSELIRVLPEGTKLRGLNIKDHVAYVDFNDKLIKNGVGGSATEMLTVGAIVNTLTEFPEIHKVQILIEGKKIDTLYGHMDLSEPLGRSEQIIKKSL